MTGTSSALCRLFPGGNSAIKPTPMRLRSTLALKFVCLFSLLVGLGGCDEISARRNIQEANKLYYAGHYEEAIKLYDEALKAAPHLKEGWYNLGLSHLALFQAGNKTPENEIHAKGAIEALEKYLALEPTDNEARSYLIGTYIDSGRYEGAIAYFEKQLEKNPNDLQAVNQLATINAQAGKFDVAIKWHKKKADMVTDPTVKADSWYTIGVMDWRRLYNHTEIVGLERARIADEGIAWLQQADTVRPNHAPTLSYINLLYLQRALAHDVSYAGVVDMTSATVYRKRAIELSKKQ